MQQFSAGKVSSFSKPEFFTDCARVDYVDNWPHLGHIITSFTDDILDIFNKPKSLYSQINDVLCYFFAVFVLLLSRGYLNLTIIVSMVARFGILVTRLLRIYVLLGAEVFNGLGDYREILRVLYSYVLPVIQLRTSCVGEVAIL